MRTKDELAEQEMDMVVDGLSADEVGTPAH